MGYIYAISAAALWGLAYTLDQKLLEHTSSSTLMVINAVMALVIFFPIICATEEIKDLYEMSFNTFLLMIITQIIAIFAVFLILQSIKILDASLASVLEISYPVFVIIFSAFIFGGTFNMYFWIGSSLLLFGSIILIVKS